MSQLYSRVFGRVSLKAEPAYYPAADTDTFEIAERSSALCVRDGKRGILHRVTVERFEPLEDEKT